MQPHNYGRVGHLVYHTKGRTIKGPDFLTIEVIEGMGRFIRMSVREGDIAQIEKYDL